MMEEYDMDRDLWQHIFAVGKLTETVVPYVFPSIIYAHLFLLNKI